MRHTPLPARSPTCRIGTWLKLALCGLALLSAGVIASEPVRPGKYAAFRQKIHDAKQNFGRMRQTSKIIEELGSVPPKPLQVFEYGPSRLAYLRNPKRYKYQYVCVVARMGTVEEGIWHRRRAPVRWWRIPPFHVRIVRPNPAGMLDHMIMTGKLKLHKKYVTITATNEKTGTIKQVTRPMTVVERTDKDLPKRLRKKIKAIEAGEQWEEKPRRSQGRWGPTDDKEAKQEDVRKLLQSMGIESEKDEAKAFTVADEDGETYDRRELLRLARSPEGRREIAKQEKREAREERKRQKKTEKDMDKKGNKSKK